MPKIGYSSGPGTFTPILGGVDEATADATFLPKTGGTVNGNITGPHPTAAKHAATKYYADHWFPVGVVSGFGGNYVPTGWLHCNGQAVSRTYYSELFAVCSTRFGGGDGSTTFNLPDCRDRTVVAPYGYDNMGTVGAVGGTTDVTLSRGHMPGSSGAWFVHNGGNRTCINTTYGGTGATYAGTYAGNYGNPQYAQTGASSIGIATLIYGGGSGGHTNVQPSLTLHFMIKY